MNARRTWVVFGILAVLGISLVIATVFLPGHAYNVVQHLPQPPR